MGVFLLLASCTDDYKDWADPQVVGQPETVSFGDGSVSGVDIIKFAEFAEDQATVKVCNLNAPSSSDADYTAFYTITLGDQTFELNNDGTMSVSDLQSYIESVYGKAPIERDIEAVVSMWLTNGSTTVKTATSQSFMVKAIPDAPFIDPNGYFVVGNIDGWSCRRVDDYHMTNNGGDVYDNPVFSLTINAVEGVDPYEIKIVPASAFSDDGNITNWDIALSALPGSDVIAYEGHFSYSNAGGNIKFAADPSAKAYTITCNLMEGTYTVTPFSFAPYIYEIGNSHGWSQSMPLYSPNVDGKYQGYYYLNGGFKFKPNESNWDGDWGQNPNGPTGTLVQDGEQDCYAEAGFYVIDVDLSAMTYKLTQIEFIDIVGGVEGGASDWSSGPHMTYNVSEGCWEADVTFTGVFKFRGNGNWSNDDGNFGGTLDNIINGSNDNLEPSITGTPVHVKLFLSYNGKSYCEMKAQ